MEPWNIWASPVRGRRTETTQAAPPRQATLSSRGARRYRSENNKTRDEGDMTSRRFIAALAALVVSGAGIAGAERALPPVDVGTDKATRGLPEAEVEISGTAELELALAHVRAGDASAARRAMAGIEDAAVRDVVAWHLLRARSGTFDEAEAFLRRNPGWPGLDLLRMRAEATMPTGLAPERVLAFFDGAPPEGSRGALMLATALDALGRVDEAQAVAIEHWLREPMSAASHAGFLALFGDVLIPYHGARLDRMAWEGHDESAERMLGLVGGSEAALGRARVALRRMAPGVDARIEAVPDGLRDHPGLAYERFRWRLEKGRRDGESGALAILFQYDGSADALGDPAAWGAHRERLARGLMQDGRHREAYRVAARNFMAPGTRALPGTEWLAGYVALRFLDMPAEAAGHFRRFGENVASPISKGRAGYWLGRALEAAGDGEGARAAYADGARYQTSFYGQLAAERAGVAPDPRLAGAEVFAPLAETPLAVSTVLRAARALHAIGERTLAERFLTHLAEGRPREETGSLLDFVLDELGDAHVALLVAKRAAQEGHELHRGYFPVTDLARLESGVAPELKLAIARRESEFDPVVMSHAGARGLMQLMPGTAREMAAKVGEPYDLAALTADPLYNARLGSAYLLELEAEFGRSPVLVPAAYNAGPSRARAWSRRLGDPKAAATDIVDWIEDVPFSETRNYIMRVSESLLPYRARLAGEVGPAVRLSEELKSR
jgi:soluble lytic murein transglycosylase